MPIPDSTIGNSVAGWPISWTMFARIASLLRLTPVMERQLMLACRKNRSLSTAAQALWEIVREEGENLTAARVEDA